MKHYDVLTIGHISLDYNIDYTGTQRIEMGGAVLYSSAAGHALGHKVAALTKLAPEDYDRLKELVLPEEDIYCIPSRLSTSIKNEYHTADKERRTCTCISQGDPFTEQDIPDFDCDIYHFAGLIYGDFSGELIQTLSKRGKTAVDVQGLLRHTDPVAHTMYFEDWAEKNEILPYITYLKTDAAEAEILTGQPDREVAAKMLFDWGAKEIVITHNTEVISYDGKELCRYPLKPRNLSGRSGRGDTTFAAYISERLNHTMDESLLYAAATVSNKMESPGPFRGNRDTVAAYIKEFY